MATVPGHTQGQAPTVRSSSAAVLIDVTVFDKDGRPITDLKPEDFELTEDGKAQQIVSASLIRGGQVLALTSPVTPGGTPAAGTAPTAGTPVGAGPRSGPALTVTAILFDSLSADTRPFATKAAAEFISTLASPNEYAGVFQSGLSMVPLQPFTHDTAALRRAVDRVAVTASNNLSPDAERKRATLRTQGLDPAAPVTAGAESALGWTTIADREARLYGDPNDSEKMLTQLALSMDEGYSRFLTEYEGDASLSGLRSTVEVLARVEGRKSILYFTEELPITSRLKARFDALIGEANRANVTIYPVDAAGLRIHSKEAETARSTNLAGAQGVGDASRGDGAYTRDMEKLSEGLSSRPASALGRLAAETGGFPTDSTNDLGKGIARMQVERTTYYLLGYQPTNAAADGKFRKVTVKVKRGKFTVRARPGYVATTCRSDRLTDLSQRSQKAKGAKKRGFCRELCTRGLRRGRACAPAVGGQVGPDRASRSDIDSATCAIRPRPDLQPREARLAWPASQSSTRHVPLCALRFLRALREICQRRKSGTRPSAGSAQRSFGIERRPAGPERVLIVRIAAEPLVQLAYSRELVAIELDAQPRPGRARRSRRSRTSSSRPR